MVSLGGVLYIQYMLWQDNIFYGNVPLSTIKVCVDPLLVDPLKHSSRFSLNFRRVLSIFPTGVDNDDDMQHLDHEIKELNESNLKIEADMMQLQTQVNIHICDDMMVFKGLRPDSV